MLNVKKTLTKILTSLYPSNAFVHVNHEVLSNVTLTNHGYSSGDVTFTKSGYYPIGVVGFQLGYISGAQSEVNVYYLRMLSQSNGSVTIGYGVRNFSGSNVTFNFYADVLWAKVGGVIRTLKKTISNLYREEVVVC